MSLLSKLKYWYNDPPAADDIPVDADSELVEAPEAPKVIHGGIVKVKSKQFIADEQRHGGRVVRVMPRQLRHMKELAEKTDD